MNVKKFVEQLKETIVGIKTKGADTISCDSLIAYLDEIEKAPESGLDVIRLEKYKVDLQRWAASHNHQHESDLEMFRSVISSGQSAIKTIFLLNGGASIAMLAFIGHLAQFNALKVPEFAACLLPFVFGVLAIAITSAFTYLTQWLYASPHQKAQKAGLAFNVLCIVLGLSACGFFTWGILRAYSSFVTYLSPLT